MSEATQRNFSWVDYVVSGAADELSGFVCSCLFEESASARNQLLVSRDTFLNFLVG